MGEIVSDAKVVHIDYICDTCGIGHLRNEKGTVLLSHPPQYELVCNHCGTTTVTHQRYPYYDYRKVEDNAEIPSEEVSTSKQRFPLVVGGYYLNKSCSLVKIVAKASFLEEGENKVYYCDEDEQRYSEDGALLYVEQDTLDLIIYLGKDIHHGTIQEGIDYLRKAQDILKPHHVDIILQKYEP